MLLPKNGIGTTGQSPIEQFSIKKIARVSYRTDKFFFFGDKMLQHQNVSATKRHVTKRSWHQNLHTKKLNNCTKISIPPQNKSLKNKFYFGDKNFYRPMFLLESVWRNESFSNGRLTCNCISFSGLDLNRIHGCDLICAALWEANL